LPQAEFVEQVGGDKVDVTVMVPPGASPHTYEPTPRQMVKIAEAEMYAMVGSNVEFEMVWMDSITDQNTDMLLIDCSEGTRLIIMSFDYLQKEDYQHNGSMDPHIWLSPVNAQIMVQNICDGLTEVDPTNKSYYEANRDFYLQELEELDKDIEEKLSDFTNRIFMVHHPSFGYFAEEYDLTMLPIEEEGKAPTPAGLAGLIEEAREHNVKVIFAEPQFNPEVAEVIADTIDGEVVFIDALAKDYNQNMRILADRLAEAME
jgi:zinc transport system substrate-binding protein